MARCPKAALIDLKTQSALTLVGLLGSGIDWTKPNLTSCLSQQEMRNVKLIEVQRQAQAVKQRAMNYETRLFLA